MGNYSMVNLNYNLLMYVELLKSFDKKMKFLEKKMKIFAKLLIKMIIIRSRKMKN